MGSFDDAINDASERLEQARKAYRKADTNLSLEEVESRLNNLREPQSDLERELVEAKEELEYLRSMA